MHRLCSEDLQLRRELNLLTSKAGSSHSLHDELDVLQRRMANRDVKIGRLRKVFSFVRDLLDGVLGVLEVQYYVTLCPYQ